MNKILTILAFLIPFSTATGQIKWDENARYLFPKFRDGTVKLKSGITLETQLNYCRVLGEIQFIDQGKLQKIGDLSIIDTVIIEGRKFIFYEERILELLLDTPVQLFIQHCGKLIPPAKKTAYGGESETTAIDRRSSLIYEGLMFELDLPEGYGVSLNNIFFLRKKSRLIKTNTLKQVEKVFPAKKAEIREFVKWEKTDFENIDDVVRLIELCNR